MATFFDKMANSRGEGAKAALAVPDENANLRLQRYATFFHAAWQFRQRVSEELGDQAWLVFRQQASPFQINVPAASDLSFEAMQRGPVVVEGEVAFLWFTPTNAWERFELVSGEWRIDSVNYLREYSDGQLADLEMGAKVMNDHRPQIKKGVTDVDALAKQLDEDFKAAEEKTFGPSHKLSEPPTFEAPEVQEMN